MKRGITKRADGRYEARFTDAGRRRSVYGATLREVQAKLSTAKDAAAVRAHAEAQAAAVGLRVDGAQTPLARFLETWLVHAAQRVRPRTLTRYREIVRLYIVPALGERTLARLSPDDVDDMLRGMQEKAESPASARTAAHTRAVLRNALRLAEKRSLVGRNVASLADPPKVVEREVRPLSPDGARQLLAAVRGDRLEALFTVALALGLRQSEALGLRWSDVDEDRRELHVDRTLQRIAGEYVTQEPKTTKSRRTVALPSPVIVSLREHRDRQAFDRARARGGWEGEHWGSLVFCNEVGAPLSGTSVTHRFQRLLEAAGLPAMRYHDLRHGAASLMAVQGVPVRVAMEILGHSQISTTMNIYAHVAPEHQREAVDRIAGALWG